MLEEPDGDGGGDQGVPAGGAAHGLDQQGGAGVLEEEAAGAVAQGGVGVVVLVEGGHHDHAHRVGDARSGQGPGDLQTVQPGHADVDETHVGTHPAGEFDALGAVGGLADHFEVGLGAEDQPETGTDHFLVVRDQYARPGPVPTIVTAHADDPSTAARTGKAALTHQPPSAVRPLVSDPSTASTRSRRPTRPKPPRPPIGPVARVCGAALRASTRR